MEEHEDLSNFGFRASLPGVVEINYQDNGVLDSAVA